MNPEEKAKELVDKFSYPHTYITASNIAKQCALICVDEQINLYEYLMGLGLLKDNSVGLELVEVKQEIEKL